jgi:hypothetical protein
MRKIVKGLEFQDQVHIQSLFASTRRVTTFCPNTKAAVFEISAKIQEDLKSIQAKSQGQDHMIPLMLICLQMVGMQSQK